MSRAADLTGQRFERLLVESLAAGRATDRGVRFWWCACDCGARARVRADNLRAGFSRSCGCLRDEKARARVGQMRAVARDRVGRWVWRVE